MKFTSLRAATAIALVLSATAAYAQTQKEQAPGTTPRRARLASAAAGARAGPAGACAGHDRPGRRMARRHHRGAEKSEPREQSHQGHGSEGYRAQGEGHQGHRAEEYGTQGKGHQGRCSEDGRACRQGHQGKCREARYHDAAKEKSASDKASPSDGATKAGTQPRAQLSEQQQTRVRETVLKQRGGRVTNVNFSVTIGTRVPRSVQLRRAASRGDRVRSRVSQLPLRGGAR